MVPRYSRPQMAAIWAPENRFRIWFVIEAHACDAMAGLGIIPKDAARAIWEGGKKAMAALQADPKGNVEKVDAIERVTKHDVIAFRPPSQIALVASLGMIPSSAMASQACASISHQIRKRLAGAQMAAICGRV